MSAEEHLLKRFKWYWEMRNGKFGKQLRPTVKFLAKHIRKFFPQGEAPRIVNATPGAGRAAK